VTYLKFWEISSREEVDEARYQVSINHSLNRWVLLIGEQSSEADSCKELVYIAWLLNQVKKPRKICYL
jgi:hypothetical protein